MDKNSRQTPQTLIFRAKESRTAKSQFLCVPIFKEKYGGHIALFFVRPFVRTSRFGDLCILGTMYARILEFHICIAYVK